MEHMGFVLTKDSLRIRKKVIGSSRLWNYRPRPHSLGRLAYIFAARKKFAGRYFREKIFAREVIFAGRYFLGKIFSR